MNKGIKISTGEIICILNSDDIYQNNKTISTIAKIIKQNSNYDIFFSDVVFFNNTKFKLSKMRKTDLTKTSGNPNFTGIEFDSMYTFNSVDYYKANFKNCLMCYVAFKNSKIQNCNFNKSNFICGYIFRSILLKCNFKNANLESIKISESIIKDSKFNLAKIDFGYIIKSKKL